MGPQRVRDEFFRQVGDHLYLRELFESLPDVYLFVKNRHGQFVMTLT
jgi:hypothetical protein